MLQGQGSGKASHKEGGCFYAPVGFRAVYCWELVKLKQARFPPDPAAFGNLGLALCKGLGGPETEPALILFEESISSSCCCSLASRWGRSPRLSERQRRLAKVRRVKRRNSQFGVFFGHGSVGEHQAPMGTEQDAVSHRGDRAAARRPPARAEESGYRSWVGLFHWNRSSAGSQVPVYRRDSTREHRTRRKSELRCKSNSVVWQRFPPPTASSPWRRERAVTFACDTAPDR